MKKVTRTWKVYGREGHRQRESFRDSHQFQCDNGCKFTVKNSDLTGTNDYTIVEVVGANADVCEDSFFGQLMEGVFENSNFGRVTEVVDGIEVVYQF